MASQRRRRDTVRRDPLVARYVTELSCDEKHSIASDEPERGDEEDGRQGMTSSVDHRRPTA
eukprot:6643-Eustigmatos_ZCMA.PRE.1